MTNKPHVCFIAPIFNYYPVLLHSLIAQTYENWFLILIHDTPNTELEKLLFKYQESRVRYMCTEERYNDWGHSLRSIAIKEVPNDIDLIIHTNADNYCGKFFLEMMVDPFIKNPAVNATFCNFVNNAFFTEARLEIGFCDCGNFCTKASVAKEVGWRSREFAADWLYINDVIQKVGINTIVKVPRVLFYHN